MSELDSYFSELREIEAKRIRNLDSAAEEVMKLRKAAKPDELNDLRSAWQLDVGYIDREATIQTLEVIEEILDLVGGEKWQSQCVTQSITRLIWALWDLRDGRKLPPVVQPPEPGVGRRETSTGMKMLRTSLAAAVRLLEQKTGNTDEAAKHVFAGLPAHIKLVLSDANWETLRQWRWDAAREPKSDVKAAWKGLYEVLK
jgi:hypothetical protein